MLQREVKPSWFLVPPMGYASRPGNEHAGIPVSAAHGCFGCKVIETKARRSAQRGEGRALTSSPGMHCFGLISLQTWGSGA